MKKIFRQLDVGPLDTMHLKPGQLGWKRLEQWRKEISRDTKDGWQPTELIVEFRNAIDVDTLPTMPLAKIEAEVTRLVELGLRRYGRFGRLSS